MKFACSSLLRLNLLPSFLSPEGCFAFRSGKGRSKSQPAAGAKTAPAKSPPASDSSGGVGQRSKASSASASTPTRSIQELSEERGAQRLRVFDLDELQSATNGFSRALKVSEGGLRLRLPRLLPLRRRRPRRPRRQAPQPAQPSGQFASSHLLYSLLFLLFFSPKIIHAMLHFGIRFVMPYRICSSESLNSVTIRLIIVFDHTVAEYLCSIWMESLEIYSDSDLIL